MPIYDFNNPFSLLQQGIADQLGSANTIAQIMGGQGSYGPYQAAPLPPPQRVNNVFPGLEQLFPFFGQTLHNALSDPYANLQAPGERDALSSLNSLFQNFNQRAGGPLNNLGNLGVSPLVGQAGEVAQTPGTAAGLIGEATGVPRTSPLTAQAGTLASQFPLTSGLDQPAQSALQSIISGQAGTGDLAALEAASRGLTDRSLQEIFRNIDEQKAARAGLLGATPAGIGTTATGQERNPAIDVIKSRAGQDYAARAEVPLQQALFNQAQFNRQSQLQGLGQVPELSNLQQGRTSQAIQNLLGVGGQAFNQPLAALQFALGASGIPFGEALQRAQALQNVGTAQTNLPLNLAQGQLSSLGQAGSFLSNLISQYGQMAGNPITRGIDVLGQGLQGLASSFRLPLFDQRYALPAALQAALAGTGAPGSIPAGLGGGTINQGGAIQGGTAGGLGAPPTGGYPDGTGGAGSIGSGPFPGGGTVSPGYTGSLAGGPTLSPEAVSAGAARGVAFLPDPRAEGGYSWQPIGAGTVESGNGVYAGGQLVGINPHGDYMTPVPTQFQGPPVFARQTPPTVQQPTPSYPSPAGPTPQIAPFITGPQSRLLPDSNVGETTFPQFLAGMTPQSDSGQYGQPYSAPYATQMYRDLMQSGQIGGQGYSGLPMAGTGTNSFPNPFHQQQGVTPPPGPNPFANAPPVPPWHFGGPGGTLPPMQNPFANSPAVPSQSPFVQGAASPKPAVGSVPDKFMSQFGGPAIRAGGSQIQLGIGSPAFGTAPSAFNPNGPTPWDPRNDFGGPAGNIPLDRIQAGIFGQVGGQAQPGGGPLVQGAGRPYFNRQDMMNQMGQFQAGSGPMPLGATQGQPAPMQGGFGAPVMHQSVGQGIGLAFPFGQPSTAAGQLGAQGNVFGSPVMHQSVGQGVGAVSPFGSQFAGNIGPPAQQTAINPASGGPWSSLQGGQLTYGSRWTPGAVPTASPFGANMREAFAQMRRRPVM